MASWNYIIFMLQASHYKTWLHKVYAGVSVLGLLSSALATVLFYLLAKKISKKLFFSKFIATSIILIFFVVTTISVFASPFGFGLLGKPFDFITTVLYKAFAGTLYIPYPNGDVYSVSGETIFPYIKSYLMSLKKVKHTENGDKTKKGKAKKVKIEPVTEKEIEGRFKKDMNYLIKVEKTNGDSIVFRVEAGLKSP